jgi:ABC-type transport system involved in multi-copper enzyme maturation permease subunit
MFWNLLAIENTKNLRRSLLWVELILLVLVELTIFIFLFSAIQDSPRGVTITAEDHAKIPQLVSWPGSLEFALGSLSGTNLGVLLLIVFVGTVTAQEYTLRTYRLWLSRGTPRPLLLTAKFTATLVPTLAIVLVALVSGAAISAVFSIQLDGSLHLDQVSVWQLGLSLLRTAYSMLPYAALTFLIAITTRSTAAAIGGGLAFALLIESFLAQGLAIAGGSLGQMAKYLPGLLSNSLLNLNRVTAELSGGTQSGLISPVPAAVGIAIWTLSFVAIAMLVFRRQDFTD